MREFDMPPEENAWELRVKRNLNKLHRDNIREEIHKTPDQMRKDIKDLQFNQMVMSIAFVILAIIVGCMYKGWI